MGFSEDRQKSGVKAAWLKCIIDNLMKPCGLGFLPVLKEVNESLGDFLELFWFTGNSVSLPQACWFDDQIAQSFEVGDGFNNLFSGFTKGEGRLVGVNLQPTGFLLAGVKQSAKELLAVLIEARQKVIEITDKPHLVS